jgi:hypothetical protein
MAHFHIMRIAVNRHLRIYDELIESVAGSLTDLGHSCTVALNWFDDTPTVTNILIGSTIFAARHFDLATAMRGRRYIVYQLEQLDTAHGLLSEWPEYEEVLAGAAWIWDYAPSSAAFLKERGFPRVTHLPPGFHPSLERFTTVPEPDLDVLFVGSIHPRRTHLLETIRASGATVARGFDLYGEARDSVMARAKIHLNIHAWDDLPALETIRLSLLLANRCFVISETGDHNPYGDGIVSAGYDALAATCLDYLGRSPDERRAIAGRGHGILRARPMTEGLRAALRESVGI